MAGSSVQDLTQQRPRCWFDCILTQSQGLPTGSLIVGRIQLVAEGLMSLLSCWLPARRCSQLLKVVVK